MVYFDSCMIYFSYTFWIPILSTEINHTFQPQIYTLQSATINTAGTQTATLEITSLQVAR